MTGLRWIGRSSDERSSSSGLMTRWLKNCESCSRRRDLSAFGVGGELGLDHALAKIGRLIGDLAEPGAEQPENQTDAPG